MGFREAMLDAKRPASVNDVVLPRRETYFASPGDWRDQVIYFLLPDRFSDGNEAGRPLVTAGTPDRARFRPDGWRWDAWSDSGGGRYQGGTIAGVTSKLPYLHKLGVTALWVGPVFKQRLHWDSYHGYAIQDYLEVDPRLGTRADVVALVKAAHHVHMRVLLDVVINHSGNNWVYVGDVDQPPYRAWPGTYTRGRWRDGQGGLADFIAGDDDGVWPSELQPDGHYTRAGEGNLGAGDLADPHAEFRRTDFIGDRDINFDGTSALADLARCYKYWIALTDCDGFRIDTLKHVDAETGRNFCGGIKEFAAGLGKTDFFLVGEVAGADADASRYREVLGSNLDATLDIGESRRKLHAVAKGLEPPSAYFDVISAWEDDLGSHRNAGAHHVTILDDHDHVSGEKVRFSEDAEPAERQVVAGVALQLFGLGIPCIYYGTEQALAGPEPAQRPWLPDYGGGDPSTDRYLREAMFGPAHPRRAGRDGLAAGAAGLDPALPGFGAFGTTGAHCFDETSPAYVRIAHLADVRRRFPSARHGRQYLRPLWNGSSFAPAPAGALVAWSRILDDEELLCVVNANGRADGNADVLVDAALNAAGAPGNPWRGGAPAFRVVANSAEAGAGGAARYTGPYKIGQHVPVQLRDGGAYVAIRGLPPAEVLVLVNR